MVWFPVRQTYSLSSLTFKMVTCRSAINDNNLKQRKFWIQSVFLRALIIRSTPWTPSISPMPLNSWTTPRQPTINVVEQYLSVTSEHKGWGIDTLPRGQGSNPKIVRQPHIKSQLVYKSTHLSANKPSLQTSRKKQRRQQPAQSSKLPCFANTMRILIPNIFNIWIVKICLII